jgi:hypothetical protein
MFNFILNKYRQHQLERLIKQERPKQIVNWNDIKSVALIFCVGNSDYWNLIHRFITTQEKAGKSITLIGLQPHNYETNYIFSHTRTTICHEGKDFNKLGMPKEETIHPFIENHYDVVIDATPQPNFFGKYLTARSNADLHVGYSNTESEEDEGLMEMYDLIIKDDHALDFREFIEQTVKYLSMISK